MSRGPLPLTDHERLIFALDVPGRREALEWVERLDDAVSFYKIGLGMLTGGVQLAGLSVKVGDAVLTYGNFIQSVVQFLLIALCLFLFVKSINRARKLAERTGTVRGRVPLSSGRGGRGERGWDVIWFSLCQRRHP